MLKKAGIVTVGVTAALLAAAPIASAGESPDHSKSKSQDDDHGKKKHHSKKKHHDDGDQDGTGNIKCSAEGGDLDNDATGGAIGQVAGPVLSGNTGQAFSCNSFFNDFLNDNEVNIAS